MTAERRTGSSIPQPLAPVTGGNGSITAISAVIRSWHSRRTGRLRRDVGQGDSRARAGQGNERRVGRDARDAREAAAPGPWRVRCCPADMPRREPRQRAAGLASAWSGVSSRPLRPRGRIGHVVEGIPISRTNNADPRHSVRQGRHVGRFPAHLGSGHPHGDFGAFQRRCRGLRAPCRRQSLRSRAAALAPRLAGGDRDNVRIRQIVGAGTRHSGHA